MKKVKIRDYEKKESEEATDDTLAAGEVLGLDSYEVNKGTDTSDAVDVYGVCKNCRHFRYIRYEFHGQRASCNEFECPLSGSQRIVECNSFDQRGRLTLNQMIDIAWIIDVTSKKVGFTD